jgi:hypothetical protein
MPKSLYAIEENKNNKVFANRTVRDLENVERNTGEG